MAKEECKILVVDDLADWRMTIGGLLTDEGYAVETAGSLEEALQLLEEVNCALSIIDVRLDETHEDNIRGLNLAAEIRRRWPAMRIVIVTGYADVSALAQELSSDSQGQSLADVFLNKASAEKLIELVQEQLEQQSHSDPRPDIGTCEL